MFMINEEGSFESRFSSIEKKKPADRSKIQEKAVQLLARREHARKELELKLRQRGFQIGLIHDVLDELEEQGYLSDKRFAREKARSLILQDYGPRYISQSLGQLQIRFLPEQMDEIYEELEVKPQDQMQRLMAKKLNLLLNGNTEERDMKKVKEKVTRFLIGRGFEMEDIHHQWSRWQA